MLDFEDTVAFAEKARFLSAHVFAYSKRKGTPAAEMQDQVPEQIKHERSAALIKKCGEISEAIHKEQIGKEYPVLFETDHDGYSVGHTPSFIEVRVPSGGELHSSVRRAVITGYENGICTAALI